jgi:hypothetical protein
LLQFKGEWRRGIFIDVSNIHPGKDSRQVLTDNVSTQRSIALSN